MHTNAVAAFAGKHRVAGRLDKASTNNRIPARLRDISPGALIVERSNWETDGAMPIVKRFGSQDSNFRFKMIAEDLAFLTSHSGIVDTRAMLSGMYIDAYFVVGIAGYTQRVCAVKLEKMLCRLDIDIIGHAFLCVLEGYHTGIDSCGAACTDNIVSPSDEGSDD